MAGPGRFTIDGDKFTAKNAYTRVRCHLSHPAPAAPRSLKEILFGN